ncbi:MAG: PAS domain S-box protein, partial [Dehalococcoidia bacterium]|nr:PAS domain S-box protein [Dehalococcoidia bacterium]
MRLFLAVLAVAFLAETAVMYLLPHLVADPHGFAAIVTDSSILVTLSAPPLWWLLAARARAAKALRRSEEYFRSLIENVSDVITVIEPDGTILYESPSLERLTGYRPGELIGANGLDLMHPDDLPAATGAIAQATRKPGETRSTEFRFRTKDGSWRLFEATGRAAHDDSGALRIIVNLRDITERKQAEEAVREAEVKYRTLVEQLPAITYVDTIDDSSPAGFTPVYVSPQIETMLGYAAEEFERNPELWQQALHPEDRERALTVDAQHYATGQPISSEYRLVARDGRTVWVHDQAVMVRDASGRQKYSQGVLMDITERKRAEEELRQSEERTRL